MTPKIYLERKIEKGLQLKDARIIEAFLANESAKKGKVNSSLLADAGYLVHLCFEIPGIETWTTADIITAMARGREMKPNAARKYLWTIRYFCQWLNKIKINRNFDLAEIHEVKLPASQMITKTTGDMLTENEVKRMIDAARNSRDRALISVLYESGMRPIEVCRLTWKDVSFDEYGCILHTRGKTGKERRIRLLMARQHLAAWQADYGKIPAAEDHVFTTVYAPRTPIQYTTLKSIFLKLLHDAGITRKVNPYIARHSRVTHLLAQGMPESVIKLQHWGSLKSNMLASYGHLSGQQQDNLMLEASGVKTKEKKKDTLLPRQCPRCDTVNGPTTNFCPVCGLHLTEEALKEKTTLEREADKHYVGLSAEDREDIAARVARMIIEERAKKAEA